MPSVRANGIEIYYEVHPQICGSAVNEDKKDRTPLLLIMGLGLNSMSWYKILPLLSTSYTVIIFDNRGTGRSSKPNTPYSIKQMATDTAELLNALKIRRVHVFGYSMGSLIAQELALTFPNKVKSLILGTSTPGGLYHIPPPTWVAKTMLERGWVESAEAARMVVPILYTPDFIQAHPEQIEEDSRIRLIYPTPPYAYRLQLQGIIHHNTYSRLNQLPMPTLILTGDKDILVPPANSRLLAKRISNSKLVIVPNHGHYMLNENPTLTSKIVVNFLQTSFSNPKAA